MSFLAALATLTSIATILLALATYHLSARVHLLETAVQGGLSVPSTRLARADFERRFTVASRRAAVASEAGTGVVIVLDGDSSSPIEDVVNSLVSRDMVKVVRTHRTSSPSSRQTSPASHPREQLADSRDLASEAGGVDDGATFDRLRRAPQLFGVAIFPYCFVVDSNRIVSAGPVLNPNDLVELVRSTTVELSTRPKEVPAENSMTGEPDV